MLLLLLPCGRAANDPGHDNLYVLKLGESNVTGTINISENLTATVVQATSRFFGPNLDLRGDGSSSAATNQIIGTNTHLELSSTGELILNKAVTGGWVYIGWPGTTTGLNVTGQIIQQGVKVCLANGTNCLSGTNTGNISTITQGSGISVTSPNGPATTIAVDTTVCRTDGTNCPATGGSGWTNTSTGNTSLVNPTANVTAGILTIDNTNNRVGIGTSAPQARLDLNLTSTATTPPKAARITYTSTANTTGIKIIRALEIAQTVTSNLTTNNAEQDVYGVDIMTTTNGITHNGVTAQNFYLAGINAAATFDGTISDAQDVGVVYAAILQSAGDLGTTGNTAHYGLQGSATGTAQTNYGLTMSASGATTNTGGTLTAAGAGATNTGLHVQASNAVTNYGVYVLAGGSESNNAYGVYIAQVTSAANNSALSIAPGQPVRGANNYSIYSASNATSYFNGSINLSDGSTLYVPQLCLAGSCQTTWPAGGGNSGWTNDSTGTSIVNGNGNVSMRTLVVDNTNGRIGIGQTAPMALLDLLSNVSSENTATVGARLTVLDRTNVTDGTTYQRAALEILQHTSGNVTTIGGDLDTAGLAITTVSNITLLPDDDGMVTHNAYGLRTDVLATSPAQGGGSLVTAYGIAATATATAEGGANAIGASVTGQGPTATGLSATATSTGGSSVGIGSIATDTDGGSVFGISTTASGQALVTGISTTAAGGTSSESPVIGASISTSTGKYLRGLTLTVSNGNTSTGESYGLYVEQVRGSKNNTVLFISPQFTPTAGVGNYTIYAGSSAASFFNGSIGIGTPTPARALHINDTLRLQPRSAAPSSPAEGDVYYDSDSHALCVYNSTAWVALNGNGACA